MKELVLVGTETSHVNLMAHLRRKPMPGVRVTLITPKPRLIYPAMLAGFVAGRHPLDACTIPMEALVQPLIATGSGRWLVARPARIDAAASAILLDDDQVVKFDALSINNEPLNDLDALELALPGAREHGLHLHPIDTFCALWPRVPELAAAGALRVAVIGGLASHRSVALDPALLNQQAIELALAIRHRMPACAVTLITGGEPLGCGEPPRLQKCLADALRKRNVTVLADSAMQIQSGEIQLGSGARLACDVPVIATRVILRPPHWLAECGLAVESQGLIAVDDNAQSTSHPKVFVTGQRAVDSPLATVHGSQAEAARLAAHLRARLITHSANDLASDHANSTVRQNSSPRQNGIKLISCGDGQAIAAWDNQAAQGRWAGWLKQWLDRAALVYFCENKG